MTGATLDTVDELLAVLNYWHNRGWGNCSIAIKDADTGWHMKIEQVRLAEKSQRLLIEGAGYAGKDIL